MNEALQTDAFVLAKRPAAADGWLTLTLFSPEHGSLLGLQRLPKRPSKSQVTLDLFDEVSLGLESANQGRTWFVREARLIARRTDIGRSYEGLRGASAFARVIARNPVSPEDRATVAGLLRSAFEAFAGGVRPDVVHFKCLYRFARDEGYPVKQEWLPALAPADREIALALINLPLAAQTSAAADVARVQALLEEYLRTSTEILLE